MGQIECCFSKHPDNSLKKSPAATHLMCSGNSILILVRAHAIPPSTWFFEWMAQHSTLPHTHTWTYSNFLLRERSFNLIRFKRNYRRRILILIKWNFIALLKSRIYYVDVSFTTVHRIALIANKRTNDRTNEKKKQKKHTTNKNSNKVKIKKHQAEMIVRCLDRITMSWKTTLMHLISFPSMIKSNLTVVNKNEYTRDKRRAFVRAQNTNSVPLMAWETDRERESVCV